MGRLIADRALQTDDIVQVRGFGLGAVTGTEGERIFLERLSDGRARTSIGDVLVCRVGGQAFESQPRQLEFVSGE